MLGGSAEGSRPTLLPEALVDLPAGKLGHMTAAAFDLDIRAVADEVDDGFEALGTHSVMRRLCILQTHGAHDMRSVAPDASR